MKHVCVIGLGQFGTHLARQLVKLGCEVLVIDNDESRIDELRDEVHRALIGDARNYQMLSSVLSESVDDVIVALGSESIEPSILCTLNLKKIGVSRIRSTARNEDHAQILRAVGATEIIFPEQQTAERTARRVAEPRMLDMFPLTGDYRIMEVVAPKRLHNKSLAEADLRREFDLLVLAVKEPGEEEFRFLPTADTIIKPNEVLMVLGRELDLARFTALD